MNTSSAWRSNARRARSIWGRLPSSAIASLKQLTNGLGLSVGAGDLQLLENRWYITHSGLLRLAQRRRCYGIGLCSVEELGWLTGSPSPARDQNQSIKSPNANGSGNGQPRLRDRLCVLIRQYNLDPILVKAYAADFCGTPILKDASRELVESFISHLATAAKENKDGLVCKLNSYTQPVEVKL